jgi:ankyrin repeat protein
MAKATKEEQMAEALATGDLSTVKRLVDHGFDLETRLRNGRASLANAGQQPAIAAYLVESGAKLETKDRDGQTPLFHVWNDKIAELLIAKGAKVMARDKKGNTPMHMAAYRSARFVRALATAGAEVNARNKVEATPLHKAVVGFADNRGQLDAIKVLLELGAERAAKTVAGHTPLDIAKRDKKKKVIALLGKR